MKTTTNYGLKKPEGNEYISIDDLNYNADLIDEELKKRAKSSGGDISNTIVQSFGTCEEEFPIPEPGEETKALWGKVKKFAGDMKDWMTGVCLLGHIVNNCVTDRADLPLSAAQGKVLMDLYTVLNTKKIGTAGPPSDAISYMKYAWIDNHHTLAVHFEDGQERYLYFDT